MKGKHWNFVSGAGITNCTFLKIAGKEHKKLSFQEFLVLPVEERRKLLAEQANDPEIIKYYEVLIHDEKAMQDKGMMD